MVSPRLSVPWSYVAFSEYGSLRPFTDREGQIQSEDIVVKIHFVPTGSHVTVVTFLSTSRSVSCPVSLLIFLPFRRFWGFEISLFISIPIRSRLFCSNDDVILHKSNNFMVVKSLSFVSFSLVLSCYTKNIIRPHNIFTKESH